MTNQQLIDYYVNLLILQYRGKPRARGTVEAVVEPAIMNQLPAAVRDAFNLDIAQGVQLDTIGKYIGVTRYGYTFTGPVTLNDGDYLTLLKIKIVQNGSNGSLDSIDTLLSEFFPGVLFVFDSKKMHISYFLNSTVVSNQQLAEVLVKDKLLPKPLGVRLAVLVYAPIINNFFGFRTYQYPGYNNHGFNTYSVYDTGCPWLSYADGIY